MTRKDALTIALSTMTDSEAKTVIEGMIAQLSKSHSASSKAKAKAAAKRKDARVAMLADVLPIVRMGVTDTLSTVKEIYERVSDRLPEGFTAQKVQYLLLHEMAPEVVKVEAKGQPNQYRRA